MTLNATTRRSLTSAPTPPSPPKSISITLLCLIPTVSRRACARGSRTRRTPGGERSAAIEPGRVVEVCPMQDPMPHQSALRDDLLIGG